jgi:hypothetical protein
LQSAQIHSGSDKNLVFSAKQLIVPAKGSQPELLFDVSGDANHPDPHQSTKRPPVRGGVGSSESASPFFVFLLKLVQHAATNSAEQGNLESDWK